MANNELAQSINKQTMLQYLSDVQRIENDIYTLKMTFRNAFQSHKDFSDYWLKGGIEKAIDGVVAEHITPLEKELVLTNKQIDELNSTFNQERAPIDKRIANQTIEANKKFFIGEVILSLFIATPASAALVILGILGLPSLFHVNLMQVVIPLFLLWPILFLAILLVVSIIKTKNRIEDEQYQLSKLQKDLQRLIEQYESELKKLMQKKARLQKDLETGRKMIAEKMEMKPQQQTRILQAFSKLRPHLDEINAQIENLEKQRDTIYGMNVLPPDYRSLECVMALHQIFRNDLADTMRDAILLYEERLFRGEMIRGLDNIAKSIDQLGRHMQETVTQLKKMNVTAERMGKNLVDIAYDIQEGNAQAANISEKIESQSFINESIKTNTERLAWYEEQRRLGLF